MRERHIRTVERLEQVARNAILGGYGTVLRERHVQLNLEMDCDDPYGAELFSSTSATHGKKVRPMTVIIVTRCRKCESCKRRHRMFWAARAITEFEQAERTVAGTLTMSIEQHYMLDALVMNRLRKNRLTFADLTAKQLFTERAWQFGEELKMYFKRLRKVLKLQHGDLRYLAIAEAHGSEKTSPEMRGRPHYHLLLHEAKAAGALVKGDPLEAILTGEDGEYLRRMVKTKTGWKPCAFATDDAVIRKQWTMGFSKFQWASSAGSAVYLCKYLTKDLTVRVRNSQSYGSLEPNQTPTGQVDLKRSDVNDDLQRLDLPEAAQAAAGVVT